MLHHHLNHIMRNKLIALCSISAWLYTCFNTSQAQALTGKEKTSTIKPDSVSRLPEPEMVLVEGGSFTMGLLRDATKQGSGRTPRTHSVTLSSFKIGKYEVTQAEWQAVMSDSLNLSWNQDCAKCPVEEVSWNDIQLFIRKLNAITGRQYKLPTESQWEFAALGGNKSKGYTYAGSDYFDEVVWQGGTFTGKTQPVGAKRPNELEIYNMSGNVAEWCQDWFNPDYAPGSQTDPSGASSGFGHVIRGGSWGVHPSECQTVSFKMGYPNDRNARVGFRLVLIP
jgi:formylglycine-generating enzyme